jgi:DNA-directed RNA polymerase I, II, and III subunit RPABC2
MDEKDEYQSDIESDVESDTENVLELPPKTKFNSKKTINNDEDEDESIGSDDDEDEDDEDEYDDNNNDDDNDDVDDDIDEEKIFKSVEKNQLSLNDSDDDEDTDDDAEDENYLQKFNENIKKNIITDYHPELDFHNYEEIENLTTIIRNENGAIVDPLHKTLPFLTKYEKTRILGERTHQINSGSKPFIQVESDIIDGYLIALAELEQKKIPFIIKRPLPNGGCEYWKLKDLEII